MQAGLIRLSTRTNCQNQTDSTAQKKIVCDPRDSQTKKFEGFLQIRRLPGGQPGASRTDDLARQLDTMEMMLHIESKYPEMETG